MNKNNTKPNISRISSLGILLALVFGLVVTLVLGFIPKEASAQVYINGYGQNKQEIYIPPVSHPKPSVLSLSPSASNLGSGSQTVTITGNGFIPESVARWNGSTRQSKFIDSSHMLIYLDASDMYGSSGRYINVFNRAPDGGYSNGVLFTINGYVSPAPLSNATAPSASTTGTTGSGSVKGSSASNNTSNTNNATPVTNEDFSNLTSNALLGSNGFMPSGIIQWLLLAILILLIVIIVRKIFWADKYHKTPLKHA